MVPIVEFIAELNSRNITLSEANGNIKIRSPENNISEDIVSELKRRKSEIIDYLKVRKFTFSDYLNADKNVGIADSNQIAEASLQQQGVWLSHKLKENSSQYNMTMAFQIDGRLNFQIAEETLNLIILNHEILRTNYSFSNGNILQAVNNKFNFKIRNVDLDCLDEEGSHAIIKQEIDRDRSKPFDLANDLMFRCTHIFSKEGVSTIVFTMHHIATDGWSTNIFFSEFSRLYKQIAQRKRVIREPLPVQYKDYSSWQSLRLKHGHLNSQINYWRENLRNLPISHSLMLDGERSHGNHANGGYICSSIDRNLAGRLNKTANRYKLTEFMLLQSCLAFVFCKSSGVNEIVIGTPSANRLSEELSSSIGLFVNTLALRIRTNFEYVSEYFDHVRQTHLDALENQELPLEKIIEICDIDRVDGISPIFQIMFNMNTNEKGQLDLEEVSLNPINISETFAKYDLEIVADASQDGINFKWIYDKSIFSEEHIRHLILQLRDVFNSVTQSNVVKLSDVRMISMYDALRFLPPGEVDNDCGDVDVFIHELFEKSAQKFPDRIALSFNGESITYRHLNVKANRLAHYLLSNYDLKGDSLVGILSERSIDYVIGVLAILKSGAGYVPLDPNYPKSRLDYIIQHSSASLLLVQRKFERSINCGNISSLFLDEVLGHEGDSPQLSGYPSCNIPSSKIGISPSNLAYVIYTSGSTGAPKGVLGEHRAMVNRCKWMIDSYPLSHSDIVCIKTSIGFIDSVWETFSGLVQGCGSVIVGDSDSRDALRLLDIISKHKLTRLTVVPSLLDTMMQFPDEFAKALSTLRLITVSGEELSLSTSNKFHSFNSDSLLLNLYGSTEVTADATYTEVSKNSKFGGLIGRPISNTTCYVLDNNLQLLPPYAIGELFISGTCLSRGYLSDKDNTAGRFIRNPFDNYDESLQPSKLFRTGDLVSYFPDGNLRYIGRADDQVKIRGFRVELGEIQNTLTEHDHIRDVVVQIKLLPNNDDIIVAYVVPENICSGAGSITSLTSEAAKEVNGEFVDELREFSNKCLPGYMVPDIFVILDEMPLLPNGKICKKSLPEPNIVNNKAAYRAPRSKIEKILCSIWEDILGLKSIGLEDNFFRLGGNSLKATLLVGKIKDFFGVSILLSDTFSAQTLEELAQLINESGPELSSPNIYKAKANTPLLLSYSQRRLWILDQVEGTSAHYNMSYSFIIAGELSRRAAERSFETIVERHQILRSCFISDGMSEPLIKVMDVSKFSVTFEDISFLDKDLCMDQADKLIKKESSKKFNLSEDIPIRVLMLKIGEHKHIVSTIFHHIAFDGWSNSIFINEFSNLYNAYSNDLNNPLAPLKIQYSDYAIWQRSLLRGEFLEENLAYWINKLDNLPVVHSLPLDFPRPEQQSFDGGTLRTKLDRKIVKLLNNYCSSHGATLFMGLHTVFSILIARYSGQDDIVIGTPIANRERHEISDLIGFFTNTIVLRSDLSGAPCFRELVIQSKESLLEAYTSQQVPFELLVDKLNPPRSLSHTPLVQVVLVLQNNSSASINLEKLSITQIDRTSDDSAKFDLTLTVTEQSEELCLSWEYNSNLFNIRTIASFSRSFESLIELLTDSPEECIYSIEHDAKVRKSIDFPSHDSQCVSGEHSASISTRSEEGESFSAEVAPMDGPNDMLLYAEEVILEEVWCDLFELECVDREKDFFDVGGNSLLAIALVNRVNQIAHTNLTVKDVFINPSFNDLLACIKNIKGYVDGVLPPVKVSDSEDDYFPVSLSQERMWLLEQFSERSINYNIGGVIQLSGELDIAAVKCAFKRLVSRHEALRTSFHYSEDEITQRISDSIDFQLQIEHIKPLDVEKKYLAFLRERFDLTVAPLFRAKIAKVELQRHVLMFAIHHIVADGWSLAVLSKDFKCLYIDACRGRENKLADVRVNYRDFARWQRQLAKSPVVIAQEQYWETKLDGVPTSTNLTIARKGYDVSEYDVGCISVELDSVTTKSLNELASINSASLFMVLLAAFKVIIARHSENSDVVIGTPIANRQLPEFEPLVGYFLNTLPLRTELDLSETFKSIVEQVKKTCIDGFDNQLVSFERILSLHNIDRSNSISPLFQIMFILQNTPDGQFALPGITSEVLKYRKENTSLDITVDLKEVGGEVQGQVEYKKSKFEQSDIRELVDQYIRLLRYISTIQHASIDDFFSMMHEKMHVDFFGSKKYIEYENEASIYTLFKNQANKSVGSVAIDNGGEEVTYGCLLKLVDRVACNLEKMNIGFGDIVGVCLPRSHEAIASILSILKLGAIFLPLDVSAPINRHKLIILDANPKLVITSLDFQVENQKYNGASFKNFSEISISTENSDFESAVDTRIQGESPAFLYYTSGSTGKPKGVLGSHRAVINNSVHIWNSYPFTNDDVVAHKTNIAFIAAVQEIFAPILKGSRIAITSDDTIMDTEKLIHFVREKKVSRIFLAPSNLALLLNEARDFSAELDCLKIVFTGGEYVPLSHVAKFKRYLSHVTLINAYGSTEVVGDATAKILFSPTDKVVNKTITIGSAVANMNAYVLDEQMKLCPVGIRGEIFVSGDSLAIGYYKQSELSSKAFMSNPLSNSNGSRIYRTGDFGRFLNNGDIEFLGRQCNQLKIRGARVEIAEIEAYLAAYPGVERSICRHIKNESDEIEVTAYIYAPNLIDVPSLMYPYIRAGLPRYMYPNLVRQISSVPLTSNGKIDVDRLEDLVLTVSEPISNNSIPDQTVEKIKYIWASVLSKEHGKSIEVASHLNFFEMGGHSLLLFKVQKKISFEFGIDISLMDLFDNPTAAALSKFIQYLTKTRANADTDESRTAESVESINRLRKFNAAMAAGTRKQVD